MYWHPLIFGLLIFSSLLLSQALPLHDNVQKSYADDSLCIDFIPTNTTIRLECGSAMFSDIYNFIEKYSASIRGLEGLLEKESGNGIWLLKSNIVVGSNSTLTINSTDTRCFLLRGRR